MYRTLLLFAVLFRCAAQLPQGNAYVNSLGMRLVRIQPGSFQMGESATPIPDDLIKPLTYVTRSELAQRYPQGDPSRFKVYIDHARYGDFDEKPVHKVTISKPLFLGVTEVTNAQYEQFHPAHRRRRGRNGFSMADDEAVVFVSWDEAKAFCDWLSRKEGLPYRLPTEAEWEYAVRAGTTTLYSTGNALPAEFHKNVRNSAFDEPADRVSTRVGLTPANPWGLFDMHGNVEEWVLDWYGPYEAGVQTDPVGRVDGDFKVTRGGSHGTWLYYLRSANRMGAPPETRNWLIGLRVAIGPMPATAPLPVPGPRRFQMNVVQRAAPASRLDPQQPYFKGPRPFVRIPEDSHGPIYSHHNHDTALTECPNGDLLAIWYTCVQERGRELAVAISRLRHGAEEWEPASPFWDAPDRNDHAPAMWFDGDKTIYHLNGLGIAGRWAPLAVVMRTSTDNGVTWSKPRLIVPEFDFRNMLAETVFRARDGSIVLAADVARRFGAADHQLSNLWISRDGAATWFNPGGIIKGVHAAVVEVADGRWMALGRGENIDGWMPRSVSADMGRTWQYSASPFPPISGGQRLVLLRLKEGPILFVSFARNIHQLEPAGPGDIRASTHLFAALSSDEGRTWPVRRMIGSDRSQGVLTLDGGRVRSSPSTSEHLGYLSVTQSRDGLIHLLTSKNHYAFNLAWIKQGQPAVPQEPQPNLLPVRTALTRTVTAAPIPGSQPQRWSNERMDSTIALDPAKGFTVEARVQVFGSGAFDLEAWAPSGPRFTTHYQIKVTTTAVFYWHDGDFGQIASGLDNAGAAHLYRLAVREDTAVQVYRDGRLLATLPADQGSSLAQAARGPYVEWGSGAEARVSVERVALDPAGAFRP
ncbi:MAG: SUMF1/EgtB/PvdO family nonheme iron enzyme [Acidobacteria bacterium]|nr:SUMF1/EgtB/PvdO family nonheme iron enzyme [Acidobacteriota bacterium]